MAEAKAWVMIPKSNKNATECVIDMRPLVLCKDCKHYTEQPGKWLCDLYEWVHEGDWFCADGEQRK